MARSFKISLSLILSLILMSAPSLAHSEQAGIPPSLKNLRIFQSGNAAQRQIRFATTNVRVKAGTPVVFNNVTGTKYTVTPRVPTIPGVIAISFASPSGSDGGITVQTWGALVFSEMWAASDPGKSPWTGISINAAAKKSYLIDINMYASAPNSGKCEIDIAGPDGSKQTMSCAVAGSYDAQDIPLIYQANEAGVGSFVISLPYAHSSALIFSVTMAALP